MPKKSTRKKRSRKAADGQLDRLKEQIAHDRARATKMGGSAADLAGPILDQAEAILAQLESEPDHATSVERTEETPQQPTAANPAKPPKPAKRSKRKWTIAGGPEKPPYPDFPLTPHASGSWMKKIRNPLTGKSSLCYFGHWGRIRGGKMERLPDDGWQEALALYKAQADDLHAGRTPRVRKVGEGLTLAQLCNAFLTAKLRKLKAGEITAPTFQGHKQVTDLLVAQFGKQRLVEDIATDDFAALREAMAERWGPVRLCNEIQGVKSVFKHGYDAGLIKTPMCYGPEFVKPSAAVLRKHRAKNGERMLEAEELRRLLDAASVQIKAMLLLGVNCGFNNKDCADLPLTAMDLNGGWINFPRPKTGIARRCPLWAETVESLKAAIAARPESRDEAAAPLVFITTRGRPWLSRGQANPVSVAARDAMKAIGIHRDGIGFATLRHVFRTVADGSRDQVAVNYIMGHADPSMGAVYRERIDDARLIAVAQYVRNWLLGNRVE